ncbi:hypothetical protein [Methanolobus sp.]|uniref:hypothetical protein n=1 Tax=Methanolobus sp. TaxID=1874737 RepID=UPI0025FA6E8F|nr:hypothetical protein [Methanolobus sp.]
MSTHSWAKSLIECFGSILKPFSVVFKVPSIFIIWFLSVIVSHIGVLAVFLAYKNQSEPTEILILIFQQGIFYSISIVLCASYLSIIFIDMILRNREAKRITFMSYKFSSISIAVVDLIVLSLLYMSTFVEYATKGTDEASSIDFIQITVHTLSIILVIYLFCLSYLDLDYPSYNKLDDQIDSDADTEALMDKVDTVEDDGEGILLE